MNVHSLTNEQILAFSTALFQAERSQATVEKYLRSVRAFSLFLDGQPVTKDTVMAWKKHFQREESYSPSTINILPQHLLRDTSVMRCGLRGLATSAVPECSSGYCSGASDRLWRIAWWVLCGRNHALPGS